MQIFFQKLSEKAKTPTQASAFDAAYDLCSTEAYLLKKGERKLFKTNIATAIPNGYYGRVAPRSGLAYKYGIDVLGWVVDSGYRGDIWVILINLGEAEYQVEEWDKIAQYIIESCAQVERVETEKLPEADRGNGGFGSTGR